MQLYCDKVESQTKKMTEAVGDSNTELKLKVIWSKENYRIAIDSLKERFGNEQKLIDLHQKQMINLLPASNLRGLLNKWKSTSVVISLEVVQ